MRMRTNTFNGININGHDIYEVIYSDATVLLSGTNEGLNTLTSTVKSHCVNT